MGASQSDCIYVRSRVGRKSPARRSRERKCQCRPCRFGRAAWSVFRERVFWPFVAGILAAVGYFLIASVMA